MRLGVAAAFACGCSMASMSTVPHTVIGYATPMKVALHISGEGPSADHWREIVVHSPLVTVIDDDRAPGSTGEGAQARMCERGRKLVAAGKAVDLVIEIDTIVGAASETKCTNYKHSFDDIFAKNDKEPECEEYKYARTTGSASSTVRVLDASTCAPLRTQELHSAPITESGHGEDNDHALALQLITATHLAEITQFAATKVLPQGVQIVSVHGRTLDVIHRSDEWLAPGDVYVVRPGKEDMQEADRVRVTSVSGDHATLETEAEHVGLAIGDELRARKRGYEWTLYPPVTVGQLRTNVGAATTVGIGGALRLAWQDLPLFVEADVTGAAIAKFDSTQLGTSVAGGLHYRLGALVPIAFVELGLATSRQLEVAAESREGHRTWTFAGVGAGAELWVGSMFVFGDLRYRTELTAQDHWELNDGMTVVTVAHPFIESASLAIRVSAGYRF